MNCITDALRRNWKRTTAGAATLAAATASALTAAEPRTWLPPGRGALDAPTAWAPEWALTVFSLAAAVWVIIPITPLAVGAWAWLRHRSDNADGRGVECED